MKGLFSRSQNNANKPIRRANPIQPGTLDNLDVMKTPPHKASTKMLIEKPAQAKRPPLQQISNKSQGIKVRTQSNMNTNKENNIPNYNSKPQNQKLPMIVNKPQFSDKVEEMHMMTEEQKSDFLKSKEELNYYEKVVEPIEIEVGPTLDLDLLLELDYGDLMEQDIFIYQPDFSGSLENTKIKKNLRTRMIDWMIEVLGNYHQFTSHQTFFLAVSIMDRYFKYSPPESLDDNDVHLSGVAAMFLASKYDDVYHIPLKDFVLRVSHNKFTADDIKEKEWEILKVLDYNISFPTVLNCLERLIYKNFHEDSCNMLKNIKDAAIHILRMCVHEYSIISKFLPVTLALAVLCYCIKCYFYSLTEENNKYGNPINLSEQENALIQSILMGFEQIIQDVENCMHQVNELTHEFERKYPDLKNLRKFSEIQTK